MWFSKRKTTGVFDLNEKLSEHFWRYEFACPDHCGFSSPSPALMSRLEAGRRANSDRPMKVSSGCRCAAHNRSVGGAKRSTHLTGEGCDLAVIPGEAMFDLVRALLAAGFRRIILYPDHVHVDVADDARHPSPYLGVSP